MHSIAQLDRPHSVCAPKSDKAPKAEKSEKDEAELAKEKAEAAKERTEASNRGESRLWRIPFVLMDGCALTNWMPCTV